MLQADLINLIIPDKTEEDGGGDYILCPNCYSEMVRNINDNPWNDYIKNYTCYKCNLTKFLCEDFEYEEAI